MAEAVSFQRVNLHCDRRGGVFPFLVIRCSTCPATAKTSEDPERSIGTARAARAFSALGWRVAAQRSADQCPRCVAGFTKSPKRPVAPIAKPKGPEMVTSTAPTKAPAAEPPRQPSLADIRKIRQALDETYDDEAQCYRGDASDRTVAERLSVPRAWVSQERAHAYGPERCEKDREDLAKVDGISQRAAALETQAMEVAQAAENLRRDADAMRARLVARGVQ